MRSTHLLLIIFSTMFSSGTLTFYLTHSWVSMTFPLSGVGEDDNYYFDMSMNNFITSSSSSSSSSSFLHDDADDDKEQKGRQQSLPPVVAVGPSASTSKSSSLQEQQQERQRHHHHHHHGIMDWYSNPKKQNECLERHFLRGLNFLTCYSFCRIASWVYVGGKKYVKYKEDCTQANISKAKLLSLPTTTSSTATSKTTKKTMTMEDRNKEKMKIEKKNIADLQKIEPMDTIYVNFVKLKHFVTHFLPNITTPIVLLSGQQQMVDTPLEHNVMEQVLSHPYVVHCFIHNLQIYGGKFRDHPKLSPLPFGLKQGGYYNVNTAIEYREAFLDHIQAKYDYYNNHKEEQEKKQQTKKLVSLSSSSLTSNNNNDTVTLSSSSSSFSSLDDYKNQLVYLGYISKNTNDGRKSVPMTEREKVPFDVYLRNVAKSKFILSPNGMKPECYRHYEAIGLETIPITELNEKYSYHLYGSIVYNFTDWTMIETTTTSTTAFQNELLPKYYQQVRYTKNNNMIFEEYWMEYIENEIVSKQQQQQQHQHQEERRHDHGKENGTTSSIVSSGVLNLNWWDIRVNEKRKLKDFHILSTNNFTIQKTLALHREEKKRKKKGRTKNKKR